MKRALVAPGSALAAGRIAQLVEQLTLNQRVQGSNPCAPTNEIKDLDRSRQHPENSILDADPMRTLWGPGRHNERQVRVGSVRLITILIPSPASLA